MSGFQKKAGVFLRLILRQLIPAVQGVVRQLDGVFLIRLGSSERIVPVVMYQQGVDNGNIQAGFAQSQRDWRVVVSSVLHDHPRLTWQAFERLCQFAQFTASV